MVLHTCVYSLPQLMTVRWASYLYISHIKINDIASALTASMVVWHFQTFVTVVFMAWLFRGGRFDALCAQWRAQRTLDGHLRGVKVSRVWTFIPEPIEMADSPVTFDIKILKNLTCFRPRRAVGFDRAGGAIESNCPSGSKTCRIFQNYHVESDGTVRHFDGFRYSTPGRSFKKEIHSWRTSSPRIVERKHS